MICQGENLSDSVVPTQHVWSETSLPPLQHKQMPAESLFDIYNVDWRSGLFIMSPCDSGARYSGLDLQSLQLVGGGRRLTYLKSVFCQLAFFI